MTGEHCQNTEIMIHIFTLDLYLARINLFFPFFVSISFGKLYKDRSIGKKGYQLYFGLKYGVEPTDRYNGEIDYMLSMSFRKVVLEDQHRYNHMGCS